MKKLIMLVLALAMVVAFMPKAEAADSAQLNLSVTFAVDQDLQRIQELHLALEGVKGDAYNKCMIFDANKDGVFNAEDLMWYEAHGADINGDRKVDATDIQIVKQGIIGLMDLEAKIGDIQNELNAILQRRPDLKDRILAELDYAAAVQGTVKTFEELLQKLLEMMRQPIISIELNESAWKLDGVKLGEKVENLSAEGVTLHKIANTGNVLVMIDIGYGPIAYPQDDINLLPMVHPGLEPGLNTFMTRVLSGGPEANGGNWAVIPPNDRVKVGIIEPTGGQPLQLLYYSPTALSAGIQGMSAFYEIRAYGEYIPIEKN